MESKKKRGLLLVGEKRCTWKSVEDFLFDIFKQSLTSNSDLTSVGITFFVFRNSENMYLALKHKK